MTFIIKIINFILNAIYLLFKFFRRRKQITLISRESNNITTDFKLLSGRTEPLDCEPSSAVQIKRCFSTSSFDKTPKFVTSSTN